ncbi:hypothetical protein ACWCPF_34900 [Streptomyces sp. NPDC001858]
MPSQDVEVTLRLNLDEHPGGFDASGGIARRHRQETVVEGEDVLGTSRVPEIGVVQRPSHGCPGFLDLPDEKTGRPLAVVHHLGEPVVAALLGGEAEVDVDPAFLDVVPTATASSRVCQGCSALT